eukprot:g20859.t1
MEVYCCGAELFLGNEKCEAMAIAHDGDGDENDEKQIAEQLKGTLRIFGKPFAMRREIKLFGVRIPSRIGGSKADATFRAQAKQAIYLGEIIAKEAFRGRDDVNARGAWSTNDWCITARVRHLLVSAIIISKVDGTNAEVTSLNEAGKVWKRKIFNAVLPDEDLLLGHVARSIKFHAAALEACRDALQGGQSAQRISILGWSSRAAESSPGEVGEQEHRDVHVEVFAPSGWEDEKPPEVEAENDMDDLLLQ